LAKRPEGLQGIEGRFVRFVCFLCFSAWGPHVFLGMGFWRGSREGKEGAGVGEPFKDMHTEA